MFYTVDLSLGRNVSKSMIIVAFNDDLSAPSIALYFQNDFCRRFAICEIRGYVIRKFDLHFDLHVRLALLAIRLLQFGITC